MGALTGIVCGLAAAAPLALLLRQESPQLSHGVAAVLFSFLLVQGSLVVVRLRWRAEVLPFGSLAATTFLLVVVVAIARRELHR